MKKIVFLFSVMLACGLTANAQQKKAAKPVKQEVQQTSQASADAKKIAEAAAKDVAALGKVITFTGTQQQDFMGLFEHKHRYLAQNLSNERKAILSQSIEAKINATLTPDQNAKLAKSPATMKMLIN